MKKLLEFKNLVTEFHTEGNVVKAVNNVSFTLNKGETVGIVGESGSGKSVTSLSAMRLIPSPPGKISGGEILFHKKDEGVVDLLKLSIEEMRGYRGNELAMIFQEPMTSLNPVFTCGHQVVEAIMLHQKMTAKEAKKLTIELFNSVKLPEPERVFNSYPHQISGGQKQRVMIAMAMSCKPSVLIADEPTTALDVTVQKTILELMQQLQKENEMGIMFITHDLGVIAELADKVVVMYKGEVVEQGDVWNIFKNPQHPYTKGLLACRPPLEHRYKFLPTVSDFMQLDDSGNIIDSGISVSDFTKKLIIPKKVRENKQKELFSTKAILQIKNLKTFFPIKGGFFGGTTGFVKAVNDVSFDVYPGETLGLVGESGCGKTTIGRTIIQLEKATEGQIIYKGNDVINMNAKELRSFRKEVQIIFQDPYSSLNPRMTIGNAIMEPMQVHGILNNDDERKKRVEELLKRVNLDPSHFYRYPHEFSGGQRQRIGIARALAVNPKFIICDESVSALDVSVQAQVLNLLNELKEDYGLTYIFISHDLSVVKYMSDRMVVMQSGVIEEMGDADQIYSGPKTDYTKKLIDAIPEGKLDDIKKHLKTRDAKINKQEV
ncbi:MAG: ABC transporter ATP-binding protein [Flavobacteriales bacterium]|nr:ABC transporter ATP-binding protein [Flavobacteriales bacterium]|tara:strand:- start:414386 stop:416194 length:1809 start_codon:yes stop_codon:yes gene_type:complete